MKTFFMILTLTLVMTSCSSNNKKVSAKEKRAKIYYAQGTRNLVDKEYTKALKNLIESNTYVSDSTKTHTNLGMAYYFKKNKTLAINHLKHAIELDSKNTDARLNLATIYMEDNQLELAENHYQAILKDLVYEKQFRTYYNLGVLELRRGKIVKAQSYFKSSIDINENYCPSFFQLGKISYKKANYKRALKMYREATMGTCYENPEPHYLQALSLIKLKRYSDAKIKLEEMTEKFALTKYEAMAQRAIIKVNALKKSSIDQKMNAKNYKRNILTPDF